MARGVQQNFSNYVGWAGQESEEERGLGWWKKKGRISNGEKRERSSSS